MIAGHTPTLPRTTPEAQGISSAALIHFVDTLDRDVRELHSVMVLRHGCVVAEGWWSPHRPDLPHAMFSVSKSFTATAIGCVVDEGLLALADPVLSFFPERHDTPGIQAFATMTVRHLLTMTTGHTSDTWLAMIDRPDGDWISAFFATPVTHPPGTSFYYNNGATYMLTAIVQRATGLTLLDYLQPRLFAPLGIPHPTWESSPQGIAVGAYGLSLTTEALVRFGQLYLQRGLWGERRLLSEAWVDAAISAQVSNGDPSEGHDSAQGYGYQFWRCRYNAYRASGVFGQYCVVMPDQDAVVAFTAGIDVFDAQGSLDCIWDILLPAMESAPLPDHATRHEALNKKLSSLALPMAQGERNALIESSDARRYDFDANALGIDSIQVMPAPDGWLVRVRLASGTANFTCGYGAWEYGTTTLFTERHWHSPTQTGVAASAAWPAPDRFTIIFRLIETPFYYTLDFHHMDGDVLVEIRVNVTLESNAPIVLTGRWQKADTTDPD